jgi:ubiquinone/menaquinone biosynthesis C-methylase UbiE
MDVEVIKQQQRRMWSTGDFPDIARTIEPASHAVLEAVGVQDGQRLLDVATGTGNLAIPAAQAGALVTGLDLTPELFDVARARAAEAGVEVDWLEGDAEDLPFPDASFDRVTSVFGAMFAPRHEVAAAELVRVTRPDGGAFGVAAWTPEGLNGELFAVVGRAMPPPPPATVPPPLWGDEEHVRSLFAGIELELDRRTLTWDAESSEAWVAHTERVLGPTVMAKAALEPSGHWAGVRGQLVELYERYNQADDGTLRAEAEYLVTVGRPTG